MLVVAQRFLVSRIPFSFPFTRSWSVRSTGKISRWLTLMKRRGGRIISGLLITVSSSKARNDTRVAAVGCGFTLNAMRVLLRKMDRWIERERERGAPPFSRLPAEFVNANEVSLVANRLRSSRGKSLVAHLSKLDTDRNDNSNNNLL